MYPLSEFLILEQPLPYMYVDDPAILTNPNMCVCILVFSTYVITPTIIVLVMFYLHYDSLSLPTFL